MAVRTLGPLVLVLLLVIASPAVSSPETEHATSPTSNETTTSPNHTSAPAESGGASLGASISAFIQVTTVDTHTTVENRMWIAAFNSTTGPAARVRMVARRTSTLSRRVDVLEMRQKRLRATSSPPTVAERATAAHVHAQLYGVERSISQTLAAARRVGNQPASLVELHSRVRSLRTQENSPAPPIAQNPSSHEAPIPPASNQTGGAVIVPLT